MEGRYRNGIRWRNGIEIGWRGEHVYTHVLNMLGPSFMRYTLRLRKTSTNTHKVLARLTKLENHGGTLCLLDNRLPSKRTLLVSFICKEW